MPLDDVIILTVVLLVPGSAASLAAHRLGSLPIPTRLALIFCFGYGLSAFSAYLLALTDRLSALTFILLLGFLTSFLLYLRLRRGGLQSDLSCLIAEIRKEAWPLGMGLLVIITVAGVSLSIDPLISLPKVASWRYWADALEIADTGSFPRLSLQYGELVPPAMSKAVLNAFNAGMVLLVERDALVAQETMRWLATVGIAMAIWAVGHELGLRFTAPLLALLIVANRVLLSQEIAKDMTVYRAEIFGRMVAFSVMALGIRALRDRRDWMEPIVAGLIAGLAAGTHMVPLIVVGVMLAFYALSRVILHGGLKDVVARGITMGVAGSVVALSILTLTPGQVAFEGAGRERSYEALNRPFDPTLFLMNGTLGRADQRIPDSYSEVTRAFINTALGVKTPLRPTPPPWGTVFLIAGPVIALLLWIRGPTSLKPLALVACGTVVVLVVIAGAFAQRYNLYILATFGIRRLFDYAGLPLLLMVLGVLEALIIARRGKWRWAPAIALGLVVAAIPTVALPTAELSGRPRSVKKGVRAVDLLDWVSENTPCDTRILTNQRTVGVFKVFTGRVAIVEGMTPYLRPEMLGEVVSLLLRTRAFYEDPARRTDFLEEEDVDYVVVLRRMRLGHHYAAVEAGAMGAVPSLEQVHKTEGATVYEVAGASGDTGTSLNEDLPGYECQRGPVLEES